MQPNLLSTEFMRYLAGLSSNGTNPDRLPSLNELAKKLDISVASLREQVEVAKALGLIDSRPRLGMRRLPYSFFPAVRESLGYAIEVDPSHFEVFSDLRNHLEAAYWQEAVSQPTPQDLDELTRLMEQAWDKLRGPNIQIPHPEHRQLHLKIFSKLHNPFVLGLLEAYWEAYEAVGLNVYTDYAYLQQVWKYHQQMVDAICEGNIEAGYRALVEHKDLLHHRQG